MNDDHPSPTHEELQDEKRAAQNAIAAGGKVVPVDRRRSFVFRPRERETLRKDNEELSAATVQIRDLQQNIQLKLMIARFAMAAVGFELVTANGLFLFYLTHVPLQDVAPSVLISWLSSTVVEVIGIVVIIARNLFPGPSNTRATQHDEGDGSDA